LFHNIFIIGFNFPIHGIFITKRQKTHKGKGKGKSGANDDEVPMIPLQRREGVLDYSRYFQTKRQMIAFEKKFHDKPVILPRVINFPFFCHIWVSVSRIFEFSRIATTS